MSAPHLCPKCLGWKQVERPAPVAATLDYVTCPVCNGLGVLWEPSLAPMTYVPANFTNPTCAANPINFEWRMMSL